MKFLQGWFFEHRALGVDFGQVQIVIAPFWWRLSKGEGYGNLGRIRHYHVGPIIFELNEGGI